MPDFARADYAGRPWHAAAAERFRATLGSAPNQLLPERARFMQMMASWRANGRIRWRYSRAARRGPWQSSEIFVCIEFARVSPIPRNVSFGAKLEEIASIASRAELEAGR